MWKEGKGEMTTNTIGVIVKKAYGSDCREDDRSEKKHEKNIAREKELRLVDPASHKSFVETVFSIVKK